MKQTLLEMVQDTLNDLDSDEVNSISDTAEAIQVAQMLKTTFYELIAGREWPHLKEMISLNSVSDTSRKTVLSVPDEVTELKWLNYNKIRAGETKARWEELEYIYPDEFILKSNSRDSDATNTETMTNLNGVPYLIRNDIQPQYWTSFDDENITLDSYDSSVDTTIQSSKTQAYVYKTPSWTVSDSFVPDLPTEAFPLLVAETKSVASLRLNQVADQKAEQQSRRQRARMSQKAFTTKGGIRYADYGRKSRK